MMRPYGVLALALSGLVNAQKAMPDCASFRDHTDPQNVYETLCLSEVRYQSGDNAGARELLDAAIQKYPTNVLLRIGWGNIAVRSGRYAEGLAAFQKLDPKNLDLLMRIAETYRLQRDLPRAIETWEKAVNLHPDQPAPILNRAMALDQLGRKEEAAAGYAEVLQREPQNVVALNNYAYFLAESETSLDLAIAYAKLAVENAPADVLIADTLGFVLLKMKRSGEAITHFRALAGKYKAVAIVQIHLAEALLQAGINEEAKQVLAAARRANPSPAQQKEIGRLAASLQP